MKPKGLSTKLEFEFDVQEEIPELNVEMLDSKTNKKTKNIKITEHKYPKKRRTKDSSTELF